MKEINIEKNYEEQKDFNSKKSKKFKLLYFFCSFTTIICSTVTIPVVAVQNIPNWISILSASLTVLTQSVNNLCHFHEKWIYHRTVTEELKSEYRKYSSRIFEYKKLTQVDADIHFAENLESIISERNNQWRNFENINRNRMGENKI